MRTDPFDRRSARVLRAALAGALLIGVLPLAHGAEDSLNLFTRNEGLHALTLAELAGLSGYDETELGDRLAEGRYALWSGGALRAWYFDAEAQTLYFAAEGYDTEHTDRNVFRLYRDLGGAGARPMDVVSGDGPEAGTPGTFAESLTLEEDNAYAPWALQDPDGRYWFWDYVYAGTEKDRITLPLDLPDPSTEDCGILPRLQIHLRGSSDLSLEGDHQVLGLLNPGALSDPPQARVQFDAFDEQLMELGFASGQLFPSENQLELTSEPRPGVSQAMQRLDRIEVDYCRRNQAVAGQLWLRRPGSGVVTVGGLPGPDVAVIETPAGEGALWRKDLTVVSDGAGTYRVSFVAQPLADYLVADKGAAYGPEAEVDDPSNLAGTANEADYLIVAPKREMQGAAEALADYRQATLPAGSRVRVAWQQDIYDEFSQGRGDPEAISAFLARALSWQRVPDHVTFLGRGTLNHKGRPDHFPGESLIPVRMADGPWGLFPSDNRYCDIDGNGVPEFACGRIPADNEADALAYLEKLEGFESAIIDDWVDRMIGVADDPDPKAGDFTADATASEQRIADLGYSVTPLHFQKSSDVTQFRQDLFAAWQLGAALTGYWGHGAANLWGDEDFLRIDDPESSLDIAGLTNAPRLPVAAALTCYSGNDAFPGSTAISAALVGNPGGGAVATLMPTGNSLHASAVILGDHFFDALAGEGMTVGDAARAAKARAAADGTARWELDLFDVSGEPLVVLP